jgi:hypothetical protein
MPKHKAVFIKGIHIRGSEAGEQGMTQSKARPTGSFYVW